MNEPNDISNNLLLRTTNSIFTHINGTSYASNISGKLHYNNDYSGSGPYPSLHRIEEIVIGSGITELDVYCFEMTTNLGTELTTVDFTNATGLKIIRNYSFKDCSKLISIDFTNTTALESIRSYAFKDCSQLQSVIFGSSNVALSNYIFQGCNNLSNIQSK